MKHMNMVKKYGVMNLQLFAGEGGEDDQDDSEEDDDEDQDDQDEKKFSQKELDDTVKKRVAREKRKWQREQEKNKDTSKDTDGKGKAGEDGEESEDVKARKAAESRALKAETRAACFEAGVAKEAIEDVTALAHAYMAADEDLDLEEAIEKVVKKYPHFKKEAADSDEEEDGNNKKAWGERQSGRSTKKMSGVERRFYELNPDLKN